MMLKKLIHTLIAALFILSADVCLLAAPPAATIQKAKTMIEQARQHLPIKGYGISLTEVSYDSSTYTLVYRYDYTLPVTKPTPASIKETKIGLVHLMKAKPDSEEMQYLKAGIAFHYKYYSEDGNFLFEVKITPEDVG